MLSFTLDTGKGAYLAGEAPEIRCMISNHGNTPAWAASILLIVRKLTDPAQSVAVPVTGPLLLAGGSDFESVVSIPVPDASASDAVYGAYGIYLHWTDGSGDQRECCRSFIRIVRPGDLLQYEIRRTDYGGYPIYLLDGGMSAEFAVLKSAEALDATVCPSWVTKAPGYGPRECHGVPDFVELSVARTVDFYDEALGSDAVFDTVIISTGVSSIAYLARTLGAPILPLHFLVSADTVEEISTMLAQAERAGIPAYATLGHDASVDMAVAWMKLLDLPSAYRSFLVRHRTRRVLFVGSGGLNGGENIARKVLQDGADTACLTAGDIFIMHPYGGTDFDKRELARKIHDLSDHPLESGLRRISDWESGVAGEQIERFSRTILADTNIRELHLLTADTYLDLYNLATYAVLAFYKKNEFALVRNGPPVSGIVLNPYLICHPFYESSQGLLPVVFFQGEAVSIRLETTIREALHAYFPDIALERLPVKINTTRNFGGFALQPIVESLRASGFEQITYGDQNADEVWDPSDGMNAPAETIIEKLIADGITHNALKTWNKQLTLLTVEDLREIANRFSVVQVRQIPGRVAG